MHQDERLPYFTPFYVSRSNGTHSENNNGGSTDTAWKHYAALLGSSSLGLFANASPIFAADQPEQQFTPASGEQTDNCSVKEDADAKADTRLETTVDETMQEGEKSEGREFNYGD